MFFAWAFFILISFFMYYLTVDGLTKYYGEFQMFDNVEFTINEGDKTALVAKNGTGKTTLINILMKKDIPQEGNILFNKNIEVGVLEQNPELDPNKTIFDEVYDAADNMVDAISYYNKVIESGNDQELQRAIEQMDLLNAWDYDLKVKQTLQVLNISDLSRKTKVLSGGQKKRIALAKVILHEPDFLILDEPTNHLDLDMIEWLEKYLKSTSMTLLMVTHDRYFLDRVCTSIVEIDSSKMYSYKGNYSYFLQKRQERIDIMSAEISKAKNLFQTELDWIRKQPRARGTKAKYRVNAFTDLTEKASKRIVDDKVSINVEATRLGKKIIKFTKLKKSFGDLTILDGFTYEFQRLEKVGIIGPNGCGKSTFLNILANEIEKDSGDIEYGETINIGYYKQDGLVFDNNKKVIDIITDIAPNVSLSRNNTISASQFLEHFLFPPATQHMFVSKLSGGERKRLYLMTILMKQPNFLILDEPTNDLDIQTLQILEDYLQDFGGCLILVSHDRFFTDKLVEHLFVFEGNGIVRDFPGNYSDYRDWCDEKMKEDNLASKSTDTAKLPKDIANAKKKKLSFKEQKELEQLEKDIESLNTEKNDIETQLSSGTLTNDEIIHLSQKVAQLIEEGEEKELRWMELQEILE